MEKIAIKRRAVQSSNIRSIGHSFPRRLLEIEFNNGNVYRYKGVSHSDFKKLMDADSKGKEFHNNIRYGHMYRKYKDSEGNKLDEGYRILHRKPSEVLDEMCIRKSLE